MVNNKIWKLAKDGHPGASYYYAN